MSGQKLQQIKKILIALAEYYEKAITPGQLSMYSEDLEDMSLEQIALAVKNIRKNPAHKFFPLPAAIREEVLGNAKDEALEATNRIVEAIIRCGWTNPDKAKTFIGALGWRVVEREGGWTAVCERTTDRALPTLKAQWRELAASTLRRGERGQDDTAPALSGPGNILELAKSATKTIGEEK